MESLKGQDDRVTELERCIQKQREQSSSFLQKIFLLEGMSKKAGVRMPLENDVNSVGSVAERTKPVTLLEELEECSQYNFLLLERLSIVTQELSTLI